MESEKTTSDPDSKTIYVVPATQYIEAESVDLARVVGMLWRRRKWILLCTALITLASIGYSLFATEWYTAQAVLISRDSVGGAKVSSQLAQLSGLASMAGLNIGSANTQEPLGVLKSRGFATRFVLNNNLLDELSAFGSPIHSTGKDSSDPRIIVEDFRRSVLDVTEDKKTNLVTISIEWTDPDMAAKWANDLARQVNDEFRLNALAEANRNIAYLEKQLRQTSVVSLQNAIGGLLEAEIQKLMLAQGTEEYAFRIIDHAEPPARRSKPKRTMIVALALMLGFSLSIAGVLIVDPIRRLVASPN